MSIQHITLFNNKKTSFISNMDITRLDNATKCYISVSKFEAVKGILSDAILAGLTDFIVLYIDNARNTYSTLGGNNVFQSTMVDTFMSNNLIQKNNYNYSTFSYASSQDKWVEFNINNLNSLKISFKNVEIGLANKANLMIDLVEEDIPTDTFIYSLSLNIKFE